MEGEKEENRTASIKPRMGMWWVPICEEKSSRAASVTEDRCDKEDSFTGLDPAYIHPDQNKSKLHTELLGIWLSIL